MALRALLEIAIALMERMVSVVKYWLGAPSDGDHLFQLMATTRSN
jgi:hypothetical protein